MSEIKDTLKYTREHEWVNLTGETEIQVGITDYAQDALGDVVFIEYAQPGESFNAGDVVATIESVKAVSEIYAPVAGSLVQVNDATESDPSVVNSSPYDDGWLFTMKIDDSGALNDLLDSAAYQKFVEEVDS